MRRANVRKTERWNGRITRFMRWNKPVLVAWMFLAALLPACSRNGGFADPSSRTQRSPIILKWEASSSYTDGTSLNIENELKCFEIHVKDTPSFGPADAATVKVAPMYRTFNLALLAPNLAPGVKYYVSLRAVTMSGAKSGYSENVPFSF